MHCVIIEGKLALLLGNFNEVKYYNESVKSTNLLLFKLFLCFPYVPKQGCLFTKFKFGFLTKNIHVAFKFTLQYFLIEDGKVTQGFY